MHTTEVELEETVSILESSEKPGKNRGMVTRDFYSLGELTDILGESFFSSGELVSVSEATENIEYSMNIGFEHEIDDERYPESTLAIHGFLPSENISSLGKNTFEKLRRQNKYGMDKIELIEEAYQALKSVKNELPTTLPYFLVDNHESNIESAADYWMEEHLAWDISERPDDWDKELLVELNLASNAYKRTVEEAVEQKDEDAIKSRIYEFETQPSELLNYAHTLWYVAQDRIKEEELPDLQAELPDFLYDKDVDQKQALLEHCE